jgi:uncharacterized membrane protein YhaH (DUF805 family)
VSRFWHLYYSLSGRLSRRDYWLFGVVPTLIVYWLLYRVASHGTLGQGIVVVLITLLLFWPGIAISVKRWHDIDVSGWWVLVGFVPYVGGAITIIFNGFSRGTIGANRYGPDPLRDFPLPSSKAL